MASPHITTVNTNTNIDDGYDTYIVDASAGNITLTLPNITADGYFFTIKRIDTNDSNTVTLVGTGGQEIDDLASILVTIGMNVTVNSINGEWRSVNGPSNAANSWNFLGTGTLSADASDLTVNIAPRTWLKIEVRIAGYSASAIAFIRFNGDTGNNYSFARSDNTTAVTTGVSQSGIRVAQTSITGNRFFVAEVRNVATQGKAVILSGSSNTESSGAIPTINHVRGVWGNTVSRITSVTINSGAGGTNLLAGTQMTIWGSN